MQHTQSLEALIPQVEALGAHKAALVDVAQIVFEPDFRKACESNTCGKFGKCWTCPPDVGDIHQLIAIAKGYKKALVFQTVATLEDSFDIEGMQEAAKNHNLLGHRLRDDFGPTVLAIAPEGYLQLSAGGCKGCPSCARKEDLPCRHPEKALASLEAYGIAVSQLAEAAGLKYVNGQNTVTYFGAFLF